MNNVIAFFVPLCVYIVLCLIVDYLSYRDYANKVKMIEACFGDNPAELDSALNLMKIICDPYGLNSRKYNRKNKK